MPLESRDPAVEGRDEDEPEVERVDERCEDAAAVEAAVVGRREDCRDELLREIFDFATGVGSGETGGEEWATGAAGFGLGLTPATCGVGLSSSFMEKICLKSTCPRTQEWYHQSNSVREIHKVKSRAAPAGF